MFGNLFGKKIASNYKVIVTYLKDDKLVSFDYAVLNIDEEEIIENIREMFEHFDDVIKINFIEIQRRETKNGIIETPISKKEYYIGEKIPLTETNFYVSGEYKHASTMFNYDEYMIGAVKHQKTGYISPLYANAKVLESKGKVKTISR